ncbi:hypothetical protein ED236_02710 [Pseudomethylobacillus aquaticus]|uniref:Choline dehydrogenase n=1 Tax=Pseudomethylobacillus aquaticus TaxID=2676064 RepID=A0A3N0V6S2_9PROT|nr:TorF family putative porin [Pseudomethylobacillus aquaticus]ROH88385.1 hypothetical protein ED236_02710 [Pseudomethylobacillus aquaticus]
MMKHKKLLGALLAAYGLSFAAMSMAEEAAAAEPEPSWTFPTTISFVSDYIFRGQSQTWGKPAAQMSVEAVHKSGIYGGFFASNVSDHWLPGANLETDLYAGFRSVIPKTEINYDVGAIYYLYPGADWKESGFNPPAFPAGTTRANRLNTGEAYGSLNYKWLTFKTGITFTEYFGWNTNNSGLGFGFAGDPSAGVTGSTKGSYFYELNGAYEVMPSWTLIGQVGRQVINNATGLDITYYKAGVSKSFKGGWSLAGTYSGTNEPDAYKDFLSLRNTVSTSDVAKDTFFVSISRAF